MKALITLDEYRTAEKLLHDKLSGHESTPMAIAMLASSIGFLIKTRKPESLIRELVEKAIARSREGQVVMPTAGEIVRMTGQE